MPESGGRPTLENPPRPGDPFWDKFETREMILEATVWVLAEEGFSGLTLRKVADRSGQNRGLIHYYFDSKDDLLRSLLDHIFDNYDRLMALDEDAAPIDRLWTALQFFAYGPGGPEGPDRHYHIAIFQLQALAAHDHELRERFTRNFHHMMDLTEAIIEEGIQDGTFRSVDAERTAVCLIATIVGARNAGLTLEVDFVRETVMDHIEQYVGEMLIA